jgi:hypothetical protein
MSGAQLNNHTKKTPRGYIDYYPLYIGAPDGATCRA